MSPFDFTRVFSNNKFDFTRFFFSNLYRRADGVEDLSVEDLKEEKDEDIMDKYEHLAHPAPNQSDERSSGKQNIFFSQDLDKLVTSVYL